MNAVSKETMDFISQMREAEKAKVKVPVKPVAPVVVQAKHSVVVAETEY